MKENQKTMASKASGSRKLKKSSLPKFEADVYSRIPPGDLIVFSVHYLMEQKIKITLEDIVFICFQLFPFKFGLKKFQKWPDSALVSRRWSDVRKKRYVTANSDFEYNLTSKGSNLVKKVEKVLGITAPKPAVKAQPKKEVVISVKKTPTRAVKEKAAEPDKKVKALKPKAPAVIQKKIEQLFQETKITPSAPVKKPRPVRAKKVQPALKGKTSLPAPVKKLRPVRAKYVSPTPAPMKQAQTIQPVQGKKATPPASTKKTRPVSAKKVTSSVPVKQVQIPEIKAQPATQVKKAQPKAPALVKKIHPIHAKKVSSTPVKPVQPPKAKILPVTLVEKTKPVLKVKVTPPAPVKSMRPARIKKGTPPSSSVKQAQTPEIKARPDTQAKKTQPVPVKKMQPVRAKTASPSPVKPAQTPEIKARPETQVKKKQTLPVSKTVEKAQPIHSAQAQSKTAKPKTVKKTKPAVPVIVQPGKVEKSQPKKADSIAPTVTREEKERAGKFTRMMERSDAYVHYKKHGTNSKINEFDFRSLLLCTMESSAETLARNVKLFKGYAGIHNRQDLTTFLVFCEDKFSYLLKPQNKSMRKAKK